jgi:hypothetical protein
VPNYPNPRKALVTWLVATLPAGPSHPIRRIVPEMPPDLFRTGNEGSLPCAIVNRYGGHDPLPGLDDAAFDVDLYCLGPDPMQAADAALDRSEDIRHALRWRLTGVQLGAGGPVVSRVQTISAPTIRPYDSRHQVRRAQASYSIRFHSAL